MLRISAGSRQSHEASIQSRGPPTIELIDEPLILQIQESCEHVDRWSSRPAVSTTRLRRMH